jgi:putative Mn2+ efflux pump MntP
MSLLEIFLLAIGLCFDTFAVSLSSGICLPYISKKAFVKIVLYFAFFQSGFTFVGWLMGSSMLKYIGALDHWIAFILLGYIGGKMIFESFSSKPDDVCVDLRVTKTLVTVAIATSIDAFAVGISLAMINLPLNRIVVAWLIIGVVTALSATIGIKGGRRIGVRIGKRSELVGGVILVIIGLKILVEHLDFLS